MSNRVQPGQPLKIPARTWNDLLDVRDQVTQSAINTKRDPAPPLDHGADVIWVRNDSGRQYALPKYAILGLDEPLFMPSEDAQAFDAQIAFSGVKPKQGTHDHRFCIIQEPLQPGQIGRAVVSGLSFVNLEYKHDTSTMAGINDGDYFELSPKNNGASVLWVQADEDAGSFNKAIVRIDNARRPPSTGAAVMSAGSYTYDRDWWLTIIAIGGGGGAGASATPNSVELSAVDDNGDHHSHTLQPGDHAGGGGGGGGTAIATVFYEKDTQITITPGSGGSASSNGQDTVVTTKYAEIIGGNGGGGENATTDGPGRGGFGGQGNANKRNGEGGFRGFMEIFGTMGHNGTPGTLTSEGLTGQGGQPGYASNDSGPIFGRGADGVGGGFAGNAGGALFIFHE